MSEPRLSIVPPRAPSAAAPTSVGRGAQGASPFASAWAAARRWRPQLSIEGLLIGLGLYFAFACNTPFWRALLASRGGEGGGLFYFTMTPAPKFAGLRYSPIQQVYQ